MKKILMLMWVVILSLGLVSTSNANPVAWNGHLYEVVNAPGITWTQADAALNGTGWYLATITFQPEQDFVAGLLSNLQSQSLYWAGGYQTGDNPPADPTANWNWVTESGDSWGFTAWAGTTYQEPNNWGGEDEKYLALDPRIFGGVSRNWTWNDALNTEYVGGYVRESVPEPTTILLLGLGLVGLAGARRKFKK